MQGGRGGGGQGGLWGACRAGLPPDLMRAMTLPMEYKTANFTGCVMKNADWETRRRRGVTGSCTGASCSRTTHDDGQDGPKDKTGREAIHALGGGGRGRW